MNYIIIYAICKDIFPKRTVLATIFHKYNKFAYAKVCTFTIKSAGVISVIKIYPEKSSYADKVNIIEYKPR